MNFSAGPSHLASVPLQASSLLRNRRPRVLYLITRAERGGAQTHVLQLAMSMQHEFEVEIATGETGFLTDMCRKEGLRVHLLPHLQREINPLADARALIETTKLLSLRRPDLLHAHTTKAGVIGRLAAYRVGVPAVYTVHMWPFGPEVPMSWQILAPSMERLAARWCERLITVSDSGAELGRLYKIASPSRIVTIHNGIADCAERANLKAGKTPIVAMVARFIAFKDHEVLLRAFARIGRNARLMLIGDGPTLSAAQRLVNHLKLNDKVEFLGDRSDIATLLSRVDIFVLASKFELFPISILEAMRAGLPVIASDVGGIPEAVAHRETGLLVTKSSVSAMADALALLIDDVDVRVQFGAAGRRRFEERFLIDQMVARTRSVYWEALCKRAEAVDIKNNFSSSAE